MTINFDTLKASLVLYGLNAIYAILLLAIGWYLSGALQRVVTRVLNVGHRVDPLVTLFVSSVTRYGVLAVVGIAVLQLFGIQTASLVAVLGATSRDRSGAPRHPVQSRGRGDAAVIPALPHRR